MFEPEEVDLRKPSGPPWGPHGHGRGAVLPEGSCSQSPGCLFLVSALSWVLDSRIRSPLSMSTAWRIFFFSVCMLVPPFFSQLGGTAFSSPRLIGSAFGIRVLARQMGPVCGPK